MGSFESCMTVSEMSGRGTFPTDGSTPSKGEVMRSPVSNSCVAFLPASVYSAERSTFEQCCFFSRNIGWVTPKIIYFHYLKNKSGPKYPKNVLFNCENRSTGYEVKHRIRFATYHYPGQLYLKLLLTINPQMNNPVHQFIIRHRVTTLRLALSGCAFGTKNDRAPG